MILLLVFQFARFWALLDHKFKQKQNFHQLKYSLTLGDVIWRLKFFKYIFVNKNWLNDLRTRCKSPSNLVEFLEKDINLEEKLREFEGDFERDEVIEV